jgi:hypothetical protein
MTVPALTFLACVSIGEERLLMLGRLSLVLVTLLCLSSMGGAMLVAFPFLVPLHWFAARDSRPFAVGGWALLAALSVFVVMCGAADRTSVASSGHYASSRRPNRSSTNPVTG